MSDLLTSTTTTYRQAVNDFDLKEKLIQCFEKLDIEGIKSLVEHDDIFEEKTKWLFLARYQKIFNYIQQVQGFQTLYRGKSTCEVCHLGHQGVSFNNRTGGSHFGIMFKEENGMVTDILECNSFTGFFRSLIAEQSTEYAVPFVVRD
jgi:hypothetical protein